MEIRMQASLVLYGKRFDVSPFLHIFQEFELDIYKLGERRKKGRFRMIPAEFGLIGISFLDGDYTNFEQSLQKVASLVKSSQVSLSQHGMEDVTLSIGYYWSKQCGLAFSLEELTLIQSMGASLEISCYEVSD